MARVYIERDDNSIPKYDKLPIRIILIHNTRVPPNVVPTKISFISRIIFFISAFTLCIYIEIYYLYHTIT